MMKAPGSSGPLLALSDVSKRFGGLLALNRVSFTLVPGEIVGLIGPNGAGKTTLINVVTGCRRQIQARSRSQAIASIVYRHFASPGSASAAPFRWCNRFRA